MVTNVAGCGSVMKDYGHILDTDRAREFSAKVVDVHELLASEEPQAVGKPTLQRAEETMARRESKSQSNCARRTTTPATSRTRKASASSRGSCSTAFPASS